MVAASVFSGIVILFSKYVCSIPCSFRDMACFMIFRKIFQKTYNLKTSQDFRFPTMWLLSEDTLRSFNLQNLRPTATTQMLLVSCFHFLCLLFPFVLCLLLKVFKDLRYKKNFACSHHFTEAF